MSKATEIRPGMALMMDGNLFVVTNYIHVTPGNLRAKVQLKLKSVKTGLVTEKRLRADEGVEIVSLDKRDIEYLYPEANRFVFMDTTTYEQFELPDDLVGEIMPLLKPNTVVTGLVHDERVVSVEPPKVVELEITDCEPGVKGGTATNVQKEATCETGLKIRVPQFINKGEKVRISTETGEYLSRV